MQKVSDEEWPEKVKQMTGQIAFTEAGIHQIVPVAHFSELRPNLQNPRHCAMISPIGTMIDSITFIEPNLDKS